MVGRFYLRIERATVGSISDAVLLVWAARSVVALLAVEGVLIIAARRWPWVWLGAFLWALVLAMATVDALRSDASESDLAAETSLDELRRLVANVARWSLRVALLAGSVALSLRLAGTLDLAARLASISPAVVATSGAASSRGNQLYVRPVADRGPPLIERFGDAWLVRVPAAMYAAIQRVAPGFTLCSSEHFDTRRYTWDLINVSQAPNALIADLNGDGISDVVLVGTSPNPSVVAVISTGRETYRASLLPTWWHANCSGTQRLELGLRYFAPGGWMTDRSGRRLPAAAVSLWEVDKGGDMFYLARGQWMHVPLVGD